MTAPYPLQKVRWTFKILRAFRMAGSSVFLLAALSAAADEQAPKPLSYGEQVDRRFNDGSQNSNSAYEDGITASQSRMLRLEDAVKAQARTMSQPPPTPPAQTVSAGNDGSYQEFSLCTGIVLLGSGAAAYWLKKRFDAVVLKAEQNADRALNVAVDPSLEAFFTALRDGLEATPVIKNEAHEAVPTGETATVSLKEFFSSIGERFAKVRSLLAELTHATDEAGRKKVLSGLREQIGSIKESSRRPALHPVWALACALEGLLTQLCREASSLSPSVQRTATAAIDLLQGLCTPDLKPNLATEPPVHILAVDDDAISRRAISFALKKAFGQTTLAPDGQAALDLVSQHAYDVIFLDVEMPGMDGFEVCTKIRETDRNRATPVIFVTRLSDFESRAKSSLSGGQDLIAKPYLSFEITVKALTLVLDSRLNGRVIVSPKVAVTSAGAPIEPSPASPATVINPAASAEPDHKSNGAAEKPNIKPMSRHDRRQKARSAANGSQVQREGDGRPPRQNSPIVTAPLPDTFSAWSPYYLETLRGQLQVVRNSTGEQRQELVTGLYLGVHSYSTESQRAGLPTTHRLSSALETMLKKQMERPELCTPSTWNTALTAIEVLLELPCRPGSGPDLADPPARILVVDDDPVARRAVCGSLQMVFGRPDQADSGEAALALASKKSFDLIFLDILMPGIDGFATCSKIRGTEFNRETPVVFVSNHDDAGSREKAAMSGGYGFIPKPVFASQIMLTALTAVLRSRLDGTEGDSIVVVERDVACVTA